MQNEKLKLFLDKIKSKENCLKNNTIFATSEIKQQEAVETVNNNAVKSSKTKKGIEHKYIYEDKSMRKADMRTYRKDKNKWETVITGASVNYYNRAEKRYRQIDNTLEQRTDLISDKDFTGYENKYNSFKVRFAENTVNSDLMRVEKDGYQIYFKLLQQNLLVKDSGIYNGRHNDIKAAVVKDENLKDRHEAKIKYNSIYNDIDFDYEVRSDSIKEDITIKSRYDNYNFVFKVLAKGLDLRLLDNDKKICFVATESFEDTQEGDIVFTMPAAYMFDKANNMSHDVYYSVESVGSGEYLLNVIPDKNWINAEERSFPVVIDPSIFVEGNDGGMTYQIVKDLTNFSSRSDFYREEANHVQVGFFDGNASESDAAKLFGETELYIGFKKLDRIYNGLVNSAKLIIPIYLNPYVLNTYGYFEVYGITDSNEWIYNGISWNARPAHSSRVLAFAKPINNVLELDITSAIRKGYSGFVVKASTKGLFPNGGWQNSIYIPNQNLKQKVKIVISYTEKTQVRGGKNIQQACNKAGNGAIDLFTGNISFVHEDLNLEGIKYPINIVHLYNSNGYESEAYSMYKCGAGWRLNFMQSLKEKYEPIGSFNDDPNFRCFEYIDAAGNRHELTTRYYKKIQSDDGTKEFKIYGSYRKITDKEPKDWDGDEISNGTYTLDTSNSSALAIKDEAGNIMKFNSSGMLQQIVYADNFSVNINYSSSNLIEVVDSNERKVSFRYSNNKLTSIEFGGKTVCSFTYKTVAGLNCLSEITEYFGKSTFDYDSVGCLCRVEDPSGYIVEYKTNNGVEPICNGYRIKSTNKEISYSSNVQAGAVVGDAENILDDVTIKFNSEFCSEIEDRFNGGYCSSAMEGLTMVENLVGAKRFYAFNPDGSLISTFDDKLNQEVSYVSVKNKAVLSTNIIGTNKTIDEERWKRTEITQINANILSSSKLIIYNSSRNPINNASSTPYNYLLGTHNFSNSGVYVFTAIINGNIVSGNSFSSLTDEEALKTSFVALKVVKHMVNETGVETGTEEKFVRVNPIHFQDMDERIACLPFIVEDNVRRVDFYVVINNLPDYITPAYWDVLQAAKGTQTVITDKDTSNTTTYNGVYSTQNISDLTKRGNNTKHSIITRKGAAAITAINTYQASGDKITVQDDGIALKHTYAYDSYGNVKQEIVQAKNNTSLKMKSEYNYISSGSDVNGNALFSETDENENKTSYNYEDVTGYLSRTTLPGTNQNIDYAYSGIEGLLKEVKAIANSSKNVEETSNNFYYNLGYLTRVKHNSCTYDFTYDGFGRIVKVTLGEKTIIRSAYTENGTDIDGVEGATSKTVTAYYNGYPQTTVLCGKVLCGQAMVGSIDMSDTSYPDGRKGALCGEVLCGQAIVGSTGKKSGAAYLGSLYCGQYFAAADNLSGQKDNNWQNNVYASYYNKHGELIKVRHAVNRELSDSFDSDTDYISVTDECHYNTTNGVLTYTVGASKYVYYYDRTTGEQVGSEEYEEENLKIKFENVSKDDIGRDAEVKFTLDTESIIEYNYEYKSEYEDEITSITLPNKKLSSLVTDALGRIDTRTINTAAVLKNEYKYCDNQYDSSFTTLLVSKETLKAGSSYVVYQYTYDDNNNILTIKNDVGKLLVSYEYDGLNRLIRENIVGGNTTVFKYDKGGNLQFKKIYAYSAASGKTVNDLLNGTFGKTINYGYGVSTNKDLLTSYNGSSTLEYDNYGNPKKWFKHGANNSSLGYTLQWGQVSNLTAISDDATGNYYTYKYNYQGIRTEKIVNGVTHRYYLQGEQIIADRFGENTLIFYYDSTGVCGFNYNGTDYYYQKNIQGDILRIYNDSGMLYAEYSYDAWGKCTIKSNVNNIATINPFRYRGYYLDDETGLYYLNARYYDPEIGRFISPDSFENLVPECITGLNLYAYCLNNPISYTDETGTMPNWLKWLIGGIAFIGAVALTFLSGGSLAPVFVGMGLSIVLTGVAVGIASVVNGGDFFDGFVNGAADGALWGGISALGGALFRVAKILKNGIVIGESMTRVTSAARQVGAVTYKAPGMNIVKIFGKSKAFAINKALNKAWINRMMRWGVKIYDIGYDVARVSRSPFYAIEKAATKGYWNLFKMLFR